MGNKKKSGQKQHLQQSMSTMVSRAALAQLGPDIEAMAKHYIKQLGSQLATQQASTLETVFSRVVVLESIIMEKLGYTTDDLSNLVAALEDEKEGLTLVEGVAELGDVTRLEISTKANDQTEFQGSSKVKVFETGSGQTFGPEIECAILGMKAGETKEFQFGKDLKMTAKVVMDRVSRPIKQEAAANGDQAQG